MHARTLKLTANNCRFYVPTLLDEFYSSVILWPVQKLSDHASHILLCGSVVIKFHEFLFSVTSYLFL